MRRDRPFVRRAAALALAALGSASAPARAYCPSYTASSAYNDHDCAIEAAPGQNPSPAEWDAILALVSRGPAAWGDAGPSVGDIGQGCGKPEPLHSVPARFPCELLRAITMAESGMRQFCVPDKPADQVGGPSRTIISFDCGYGVGQVTSGMHAGESPDFDRERVASDATYNLATGTRILAGKWKATECVGDNQPSVIEDWYAATWAYNGLAYVNNPTNPNYDPNRGVWDPAVGGPAPYQEKVFGRVEHPADGVPPVALAYPNPGDIGGGAKPPELPEPSCASPTDCVGARPVHVTACQGDGGAGGAGGATTTAGGGAGGGGAANGGAGGAVTGGTGGAAPSGAGGDAAVGGAGGERVADVTPAEAPASDASSCGCEVGAGARPTGATTALAFGLAAAAAVRAARRRRAR